MIRTVATLHYHFTGLAKMSDIRELASRPFFVRTSKYSFPTSGTYLSKSHARYVSPHRFTSTTDLQYYLRIFSISTFPINPVAPVIRMCRPRSICTARLSAVSSMSARSRQRVSLVSRKSETGRCICVVFCIVFSYVSRMLHVPLLGHAAVFTFGKHRPKVIGTHQTTRATHTHTHSNTATRNGQKSVRLRARTHAKRCNAQTVGGGLHRVARTQQHNIVTETVFG